MIGIGLHIGNRVMGGGGAAFDVDAQAFFDRVTVAGGTLTTTEKNATNQLVLDMKSAGIWSAMKAVYPMVGASAAACAQNLVSSSFTGTFTSGWTFASTGVTGNGTSAYFDTTFVPNTFTTNNAHLSFYSRTNSTTGAMWDIGSNGNAPTYQPGYALTFANTFDSDKMNAQLGDYNVSVLAAVGNYSGFGNVNRTSSTYQSLFRNGTNLNTNTSINTITANANPIYIAALNLGGVASRFSTRQCAFSSIGDGLTDTQAANFYTAVQAFQTTLSRQV